MFLCACFFISKQVPTHLFFCNFLKDDFLNQIQHIFFSITGNFGVFLMIYCKLLTKKIAHWQKNSVIHYLIFTSSEIHTYILQHLSADIVPWQIEDGLQFQHQVKQEGLVTILKQLDFTQCVKMNMDGKICSQVLWQGVHQYFLIYKQT